MSVLFIDVITVLGVLLGCGLTYFALKTQMVLIMLGGVSVLVLTLVFRLVFGKCPHCGASLIFNGGKYCKECKRRMR